MLLAEQGKTRTSLALAEVSVSVVCHVVEDEHVREQALRSSSSALPHGLAMIALGEARQHFGLGRREFEAQLVSGEHDDPR
jgi:hypothetical protein